MSTTLSYGERDAFGVRIGTLALSSDNGVNPLSSAVVQGIRERLAAMQAPDAPHALLISASGRCFCAGADVKEFRGFDAASFRRYMADVLSMYVEMIEVGKPIVCLVHADARGGGMALALCSDFVIAADHAKFALPEAHRGLAGGGYLMPRLVGKALAAEMVLLGRDYGAAEMQRLGLVNQVCPAEDLIRRGDQLLEEIARIPASAFGVGKRSLAAGLSVDLRPAMQRHVDAQTEAFIGARARGLV